MDFNKLLFDAVNNRINSYGKKIDFMLENISCLTTSQGVCYRVSSYHKGQPYSFVCGNADDILPIITNRLNKMIGEIEPRA